MLVSSGPRSDPARDRPIQRNPSILSSSRRNWRGRPSSCRKREIARGAKHWLAPGAAVVTDGLGCWSALDEIACSHQAIRTGSGRQAARMAPFKWVNTTLGNIKCAITGTYRKLGPDHAGARRCRRGCDPGRCGRGPRADRTPAPVALRRDGGMRWNRLHILARGWAQVPWRFIERHAWCQWTPRKRFL